jgi:hypothetical protein
VPQHVDGQQPALHTVVARSAADEAPKELDPLET